MNSNLSDPNNHVPEVSPGDSWGDHQESIPENNAVPNALPPRRAAAGRSSSPGAGNIGLRIGVDSSSRDTTDSHPRHEAEEIDDDNVIRLDQAIPIPHQILRQAIFRAKPERAKNRENPRGESHDWGDARRNSARWLIGAGAAVMATIILSIVLLPKINALNAARPGSENGALHVEIEEKIEGMEAMNHMLLKQPEAIQIFRSYVQASHPDEILALLRNGTALRETLHSRWQPPEITKSWSPPADSAWSVFETGGHPCGLLEGNFPDHSKFAAYFTNDGNRLLLDWKATSAFGTASFRLLEKGNGDGSEIRGLLSSAEYYNSVWPEADYQCYRLASHDGENSIWCYARRGERAEEAVGSLFQKGEIIEEAPTSQKVTLRLERGPAGAQPNQWLVGEMLHIDWVAP